MATFAKKQMATLLLYLSQEGKMLNNQVGTLCFPCTALPADYNALRQRETNLVAKILRKEYLHKCIPDPGLDVLVPGLCRMSPCSYRLRLQWRRCAEGCQRASLHGTVWKTKRRSIQNTDYSSVWNIFPHYIIKGTCIYERYLYCYCQNANIR